MKPIVWISSPYTHGDQALNVRFQIDTFDRLLTDEVVWPLAPLWSHFQHIVHPRPYRQWLEYDLALIRACDACLRLPAINDYMDYHESRSHGADTEEAEFKRRGKPVFHGIRELYFWAERDFNRRKDDGGNAFDGQRW